MTEAETPSATTRFEGRVALVTGAGRGLGRAYAEWLAARGARVVVNNRVHAGVPSSAAAVAETISAAGGTAVADEHEVETEAGGHGAVDTAIAHFGRLDILICNAGIAPTEGRCEATPLAQVERIMAINFYGSLYPLRAALPRMIETGYGRIVLTGSSSGVYGTALRAAYSASKGAILGLARTVAQENRGRDISVNIIQPSALTGMNASALSAELSTLMAPEHVAPVVGWLCSDQCRRSGTILHAGGGRVRQVSVVAGPVATVEPGLSQLLGRLDDLGDVSAPSNSDDARASMIPELARA